VIAALAYLLGNTWQNRVRSMVRRLRSPRYAIGMIVGIAYFWLILGRHAFKAGARPVVPAGPSLIETLAPVLVLVVISGMWLFGGDKSALVFTEAEVSMLLTAPISRRVLICYKLAQSQVAILINVVIWVFLLGRGSSTLPGVLSAASVWVIFTTLNLHRMGVALSRASQIEYRAAGQMRKWAEKAFGFVLIMSIMAVIMAGVTSSMQVPTSGNPLAFVSDLIPFFQSPLARRVLYPFHLVTAPAFAPSPSAWAVAMLPALAIVLAHVWWVLRSDAAFEEAAALASARLATRIAAIRARRAVIAEPQAGAKTKTIALASTGAPVVAVVWKNAIALRRTFQPGGMLRTLALVTVFSGVFGARSSDGARTIAAIAGLMAIMTPMFGLQMVRNDLRSDMMHLPFLKTVPLAGADLVLAEVLSATLPVAAIQLVLIMIAGIAFAFSSTAIPIPAGVRAGVLLTSPLTVLALNGAICTLFNGSAVLFPGWTRLGPAGTGGIEMMGQSMLTMIASVVAFILLMIVPLAAGSAGYYALRSNLTAAVTVACILGAVALASESYGLIIALGHAFERAEPQQVT
jgi:ABC-2 type transport system permease protein